MGAKRKVKVVKPTPRKLPKDRLLRTDGLVWMRGREGDGDGETELEEEEVDSEEESEDDVDEDEEDEDEDDKEEVDSHHSKRTPRSKGISLPKSWKQWDPSKNVYVKWGLYGAGAFAALLLLGKKNSGGGSVTGLYLVGTLSDSQLAAFAQSLPGAVQSQASTIWKIANDSGINPAVVFALGWQETRWGTASDCNPQGAGCTGDAAPRNPNVWGSALPPDGLGWGRGIFQIDYGSWKSWIETSNWQDPYVNGMKAMDILKSNAQALAAKFPSLSASDIEAAAISSFNAGLGHVENNLKAGNPPDTGTTGGNYSESVLAYALPVGESLPSGDVNASEIA